MFLFYTYNCIIVCVGLINIDIVVSSVYIFTVYHLLGIGLKVGKHWKRMIIYNIRGFAHGTIILFTMLSILQI